MKKLFTSKQDSQYDSFVGKQYFVGDLSLVVEEVIAEGMNTIQFRFIDKLYFIG